MRLKYQYHASSFGCSVLSSGKSIKSNFIHVINGFSTNDVSYTDTDSLHIESEHWDKLDKTGLMVKFVAKLI